MKYFLLISSILLYGCKQANNHFDQQISLIELKPEAEQAKEYDKLLSYYEDLLSKNISPNEYQLYVVSARHWRNFSDVSGNHLDTIKPRLFTVYHYYQITSGSSLYLTSFYHRGTTSFDQMAYDLFKGDFDLYTSQLIDRMPVVKQLQEPWQRWFDAEEMVIDMISGYLGNYLGIVENSINNDFKLRNRLIILHYQKNQLAYTEV